MDNEHIRISTSKPSLKNKVKTNLDGSSDVLYWHIRFNIPLDEATVSGRTMNVTDTDGYIMRTDITYNPDGHQIVISPLDTYEQNRFYLLNIKKKVRSASGKHMKSTLHILFKLLNNQISEFKTLKKNVQVPKPRPRPSDYDERQAKRKRDTEFNQAYLDMSPLDRMTQVSLRINPIIGILGIVLICVGIFVGTPLFFGVGALVCACGLAHIIAQLRNRELRSAIWLNRGVRHFNGARYLKAEHAFRQALTHNARNELAEYGLYKVGLYL